jgi:ABC-type dipeptide/oligopeptide/nickel transport system permease component
MIRYLALKLLFAIPALWLIVTLVFMLAHIVPGDPVQQMLGEGARAEDLQQLRHRLGLDMPVSAQYRHYLAGVVHGDLGESFRFQEPVTRVVLSHYPATLELAIFALFVCAAIGIPAGMFAAEWRGTSSDRAIGVVTLLGLSVPNFALGPVLILVFSVILGWLPVSGRGGPAHLILPAITLGASLAAILTRMVRMSVIQELSSDYVRTARAKGLRPFAVGTPASRGAVSARTSQRAHSYPHHPWPAIWDASRRRDCDRDHFLLAWNRPPDGAGHRSARLSIDARLHTFDRLYLRPGQPADGCRLRAG